jgi:hypothetical protein
MLHKLMQLFGISCRHRHMSHPFAAAARVEVKAGDWEPVGGSGGHYVVCLDCGQKFPYDWTAMRVIW